MQYQSDEIILKLKEIEKMAQSNGIPFFATIVKEDTGDNTYYESFLSSAYYTRNKLAKDNIKKCLLVSNGFDVKQDAKPQDELDEVYALMKKKKSAKPKKKAFDYIGSVLDLMESG